MKRTMGGIFAACGLVALSGCDLTSVSGAAPVIDQAQLCQVGGWEAEGVAAVCKPGQKVVFLPRSFGNEQLPILFAAVNCDLRYAVALTSGAVTCIYLPITPEKQKATESAPKKP